MSALAIAFAVLPLVLVLVLVLECSRLHCARKVQRQFRVSLPSVPPKDSTYVAPGTDFSGPDPFVSESAH